MPPVHNLAVSIMAVLGAEGGPSDKTLKHDSSKRPPIAIVCVTVAGEDFRSDIVRGTDSRVCHQPAGASPVIDLRSVADSQVNLVKRNRVAITRSVRFPLQELLVVVVIVELVEASG